MHVTGPSPAAAVSVLPRHPQPTGRPQDPRVLGLPPEQYARFRDLDAARLLIDAFGGLLAATEGRLGAPEPSLRQALADLRLAFAEVSAQPESGAPAPPPAPEPEDSGILRPPSGLWVPGQD